MKLVELDPKWIMKDGKRVGFTFFSPVQREGMFGADVERYSV